MKDRGGSLTAMNWSKKKEVLPMDSSSLIDESVLCNVRQNSIDGISPFKVQFALGPSQRNSLPRDEKPSTDLSRERRSPENFYPSLRPVETNEVNILVTEQGEKHYNQIPFSPKTKHMESE